MYLKTIFLTSFMTPFDTLTEHYLYKKSLNKQRLITIWPFHPNDFHSIFYQKKFNHMTLTLPFKENSRNSSKTGIKKERAEN